MAYHFGNFELDDDGRELRRRAGDATTGASPVTAAPKVLAFLRMLVSSAPSVVTRDELLAIVWRGQVVSASALNTVVKSLRRVLDDGDQQFVRTIHGIGYAFVMPVERRGDGVTASAASAPSALGEIRRRLFVGRKAEVARLGGWLTDPALADDVRLFWVHGVGGIGKTSLVHQLETLTRERVPMFTVSCGHLRPSPEALMDAIATACGASTGREAPNVLAASPTGVLVLDGYEAILGIDDWVRERFVPRLPSGWRLVISSRSPPGMRWRVDPIWTCATEISLGAMSPDEADALLELRGVAPSDRAAIVRFAGGHPLTLVLAMDSVRRTGRFSWSEASVAAGLAPALIESFVREAPSTRHRRALDCLAVVDVLDEPLLAAMLGADPHATECFDWLSTLGMVERRPGGLTLHDLAKTTLMANLAWRNATRLGELVERACAKLFADLEVATAPERRRRLIATVWRLVDLHPTLAPLMAMPKLSGAASGAELASIEQYVTRFEGPASAAALRYWLARDPACARVVRDEDGVMLGYSVLVKVEPDDHEARAADPVLRMLDAALEGHGIYSVARWFADCRTYHELTSVSVGCLFLNLERELCTLDEEVRCHFVLVSNPEAWKGMFRLADLGDRITSVEVDDHHFGAFAHDMRSRSLVAWFRAYTRRLMSTLTTGSVPDLGLELR